MGKQVQGRLSQWKVTSMKKPSRMKEQAKLLFKKKLTMELQSDLSEKHSNKLN